MPKVAKELTPLGFSKIKGTGWHAVGHVLGLGLKVAPSGSRAWVLRAPARRITSASRGGYIFSRNRHIAPSAS